mmetsp:Transcript_7262/g.15968  ORF Transcript_7262/g.15968 Transcript_7262/m.15968 type:complete len:426 (+) Transcript_7262:99-1376(+)
MVKPRASGRVALSLRRSLALLSLAGAIASICMANFLREGLTANYVTRFSATSSIALEEDQTFAPTKIKNETGGRGVWILPVTRFTHHIMTLVENYDFSDHDEHWSIDLTIQSPDQVPAVIQNIRTNNVIRQRYVDLFRKYVFPRNSSRVLPANASFCAGGGDYAMVEQDSSFNCFASSSPGGYSSVHNFQTIRDWNDNKTWPMPLPWNERISKPVWRGIAWDLPRPGLSKSALERIENGSSSILAEYINHGSHQKRIALVAYSIDHPELLDARATAHIGFAKESHYLWEDNMTGGFQQLLPFHKIHPDDYFTRYQVHILMGGFGAAFRFPILLQQGIAVIVQDYPFEEWFLQYMEPFYHYVPLSQDLSNLTETLQWVRSNPDQVRKIALNGQEFFSKYLTYQHMESFYYELIFRLAHRHEELSHK